ncbi:MAG: sensor histidine kinase [Spirochaetota bacterium]
MSSLKKRILLSFTGVTLAALLLVGAGLYLLISRYEENTDQLVSQAVQEQVFTEFYRFLQEQPDLGELERYIRNLEHIRGVSVELLDSEGTPLIDAYRPDTVVRLIPDQHLSDVIRSQSPNRGMSGSASRGAMMHWGMFFGSEQQSQSDIREVLDDGELSLLLGRTPHRATFEISTESFTGSELLAPMIIAFVIAGAAAMVVSILIGWKLSYSLTRPLSNITQVVDRISGGDLSARSEIVSRDEELKLLADRIHGMAAELERTISNLVEEKERLRRFIMDASHELRTPVTALSAYLEMLAGKAADDPDRRKEYIDTCIHQNARSKDIIVKLLELLRMEQGTEITREQVSLQEVLEKAAGLVEPLAAEKKVDLRIENSSSSLAVISGDRYQLVTAFRNVIENAVKYSPEGTLVSCTLETEDQDARLTVTDQGSGIRKEDATRVFDRFYRAKDAPGLGSGLGLALVRQAVDNHKGTIKLQNRQEEAGLEVRLTFPLSSQTVIEQPSPKS